MCGFPQEHVEPLVRHFEAAQHAHRARDFEAALDHLKEVQKYAPHHVGARKGIEKLREYVEYGRKAGAPLQMIAYPGDSHACTNPITPALEVE